MEYTIYCSEEQKKKALKLGAPIETYEPIVIQSRAGGSFTTPTIEHVTAEQMIGWLEDHDEIFEIQVDRASYESRTNNWSFVIYVKQDCDVINAPKVYFDRKEATLAAIDAALDYLKEHKK